MNFTADIELFASGENEAVGVEGAWHLYKRLRKFGMSRYQIQLLMDVFVLGKSLRQIQKDRGWTSYPTVWRTYQRTIEELKTRGFKK